MKKQTNKKLSNYFAGIGLVFGSGIGVGFAAATNKDIALTSAFGAGIGLVVGSIIQSLKK